MVNVSSIVFFFIGVKNNIVNYKEYSDQMNNGREYLMRQLYMFLLLFVIFLILWNINISL